MNLHNRQQTKLLTHAEGLGKVLNMLGRGHVSKVEAVLEDHRIPLPRVDLIKYKLLIIGVETRIRDIISARKEVRVLLAVVTVFPVRHLGKRHRLGLLHNSLLTSTTSSRSRFLLLKVDLPGRLGLWHNLFFKVILKTWGALLLARG